MDTQIRHTNMPEILHIYIDMSTNKEGKKRELKYKYKPLQKTIDMTNISLNKFGDTVVLVKNMQYFTLPTSMPIPFEPT